MTEFKGLADIDYLKKTGKILASLKQISYKKMQIKQGDIVLDLGCGPGIDAIELGGLVSPNGSAIGVDYDEAMLKQASAQVKEIEMQHIVHFQQEDASALSFNDNHFDSCRSERLFMHLNNPEQVVAEMFRVTKPGGHVVVIEPDWASMSVACESPEIERLLLNYRLEKFFPNGYSGRNLYRLFNEAHFTDIQVEAFVNPSTDLAFFYAIGVQEALENKALADNVITPEALAQWRTELQQAAHNNSFYSSASIVMVHGVKPL
ncbi:methyltransferase domain-containing protein [Methylobacter marinus]|uniref:methyltransferase domain-containing protein n=1 Tax=Methylobacter marinus TaxID=34058 RepID=UPI00036ECB13|nr:methyltransferase domain-containing protein [Methylobacter marinus]